MPLPWFFRVVVVVGDALPALVIVGAEHGPRDPLRSGGVDGIVKRLAGQSRRRETTEGKGDEQGVHTGAIEENLRPPGETQLDGSHSAPRMGGWYG